MPKLKGFTVVELLIVVVVIGILASITTVAYMNLRSRAQDTALRSDLTNAGRVISAWMTKNSTEQMRSSFAAAKSGSIAAWAAGENADNLLSTSQLRWNTVESLPSIGVSPNVTLEIISQYVAEVVTYAPGINEFLLETNNFCVTGAVRDGTYNYRPLSGVPSKYGTMLYFDSALGKVVTMIELDKANKSGYKIACEGHLKRWRASLTSP